MVKFTSQSFARPDGKDGSLGHGVGEVAIAILSEFDTIATRYPTPTTAQEEVSVSGDHTFPASPSTAGFMKFYHDPQNGDTDLNIAMNGEGLGANSINELTVFYPGKSFEIEALLKYRPEIMALVGDIDCSQENRVQVGTECTPAYISNWEWALKNINGTDMKGYRITIKAYGEGILNYAGAITYALAP